MILTILINLLSAFIFLYILWYKLKEDYSASLIFSAGFSVILLVAAGNLAAYRFFPKYWFWASLVGVIAGVVYSVSRYKLSFYEFLDALIISLHPWYALILLDKFAATFDYKILLIFALVLTSASLYLLFDRKYKSFNWYKSGRVGFSGFAVLGVFFLLRTLIALTFTDMVSFIGKEDAIVSGGAAFLSFLALFNLSRSRI